MNFTIIRARPVRLARPAFGLALAALVLSGLGCPKTRLEERSLVVAVAGQNVVSRTSVHANPSTTMYLPGTAVATIINGLGSGVSVAQFGLITYATWSVWAADATGGGRVDKVYVLATPGSTASKYALIDGGRNSDASLAVLGDKLYCAWLGDGDLKWRTTTDGRTWAPVRSIRFPNNLALRRLDIAAYKTDSLVVAGIQDLGDGTGRIHAMALGVPAAGAAVWGSRMRVPTTVAIVDEGVSVHAKNGVAVVGYAQDTRCRFVEIANDMTFLPTGLSTVLDFRDNPGPNGEIVAGRRTSVAYVGDTLCAAIRFSGGIRWFSRRGGVWQGAGAFYAIRPEEVSGLNPAAGFDIQSVQVVTTE